MRSIVFLDFDGVLNSLVWFNSWKRPFNIISFSSLIPPVTTAQRESIGFDPAAIRRLNRLVQEGNADVVVSSGWRRGRTLEDLRALLTRNGFHGNIIGKTPEVFHGPFAREREIMLWLAAAGWLLEGQHRDLTWLISGAAPFVILDDTSPAEFSALLRNFVYVDGVRGLRDKHVESALQILHRSIHRDEIPASS